MQNGGSTSSRNGDPPTGLRAASSDAKPATPKKMRHTSIRNYFLRGVEKLAEPIAEHSGRTVREIARDPRFQIALAEILRSNNDGLDI